MNAGKSCFRPQKCAVRLFSPEQKSGVQKINLQSFRYYQAGQSLLKENYLLRNAILISRMQFKKAIDEDPVWIAPYAGMAESLLMDVHYGYKSFQSKKDSVQYYIGKISGTNQTGWEINYLQGLTEFFQLEFQRSDSLFRKAAELNPGYPFIYYYLSWICFNKNDYGASNRYMGKAISLDRLNEYFKVIHGILLSFGGEHKRAVNMFMKMLNKDPANNSTLFGLGTVYSNMGNHEKAIEVLSRRSVGQQTNFLMAYNYGRTGKTEDARRILEYLVNLPGENAAPLTQIAIVYLGLNDFNKALDYYGEAMEHFDPWISWMPQNWSDPIRKDPRFITITGRFKTYQN